MRPKVTGVCTKCGAEGKIRSNGLCVKDYLADWREKQKAIPCKVEGCTNGCKSRMMCDSHYSQYIRARKRRNEKEEFARMVADDEKRRIIILLEKYGHQDAARIVAFSKRRAKETISV